MRSALIVTAALVLTACTVSPQTATSAAEDMGFTDVKLGGPSFFGCADEDGFTRTFTAKNAAGRPVQGVICKGLLKGATVRITGR